MNEDEHVYDDGTTTELCPDCGSTKKWRNGRWNTKFLGCSRYPKCQWTSYKKPKIVAEVANDRH